MSSIVVGYVDTPAGSAALDAGITEASRRGARLVVVSSLYGGNRTSEAETLAVREAIDRLRERLADLEIDHEIHEFVRGNSPARDLMESAAEFAAELIVIGIRRRSATGKLLLGSNALEILHDADVPVLCVKAEA